MPHCATESWTDVTPSTASARLEVTDRAGRWATSYIGFLRHSVSEVAGDPGCDGHPVNDAVIGYGGGLVDDPARIGQVITLGLDETLFGKRGKWRTRCWSTSIVGVRGGQLLDVMEDRNDLPAMRWLAGRDPNWRAAVAHATLDMSGQYRKLLDTAQERLDVRADTKLVRLLAAGDPRKGEATTGWHARKVVQELYAHHDAASRWIGSTRFPTDTCDTSSPREARQNGLTMRRWRTQIAEWQVRHARIAPAKPKLIASTDSGAADVWTERP